MLREYAVDPIRETTEQDTIYSLLALRTARDTEDVVAQWQDETTRRWHDVTAAQMLERVRAVAKGLMALDVRPGSMVRHLFADLLRLGRRRLRLRGHRRGQCADLRDGFRQAGREHRQ